MFSTELFTQTLIAGLMIGVLYALMALGITFIYSIVRMINWAMGEFYMLGSYIQYVVVAHALGRDLWWLAVIISTAGTFLVGYLLEPILIKPMYARAMERRDDYATVVTIALLFLVYPTNGAVATVKGFEIIVIGGLGSIPGALIGGLLLGVVESLGAGFISSSYQNAYGFLLVLLVLLVRPYGLFGERGREA